MGPCARPAAHLGVDVRVLSQAHGMAEGFAADVTGEGPGPAVGATGVHLKPMWGGEDLGAGAECEATGVAELQRGSPAWIPRHLPHPHPRAQVQLQPAYRRRCTGLLVLLACLCVLPGPSPSLCLGLLSVKWGLGDSWKAPPSPL